MSTATQKTLRADLVAGNPGVDRLSRWGLGDMPATPIDREIGWDATNGRIQARTGGNTRDVAYLTDLLSFGRYRGGWNATTGIPTAAGSQVLPGIPANDPIRAGDMWLVTTDGTIVGIVGADAVQAGDMIKATVAGASAAADFVVIEQNQAVLPVGYSSNVTLPALPIDTATPVTMTGITAVQVAQIYTAAGANITDSLVVSVATNVVTLTSSVALTNLTVRAIGTI